MDVTKAAQTELAERDAWTV